jgi:hypothetical protein
VSIPENVYYGTDTKYFYDATTNKPMDYVFYVDWIERWEEFPQQKTVGIPIQEFAAQSPEHANIIAEIRKGLENGTLTIS